MNSKIFSFLEEEGIVKKIEYAYHFLLKHFQNRSPRILFANCMSLDIIVTLFAWIAQRFVSSNNETKYAYAAYCKAMTALC